MSFPRAVIWAEMPAPPTVNGPSSVVLSGDEQAVLAVAEAWEARGRKTRRLQVSHAFHSPRMEGMLEQFGQVVGELSFKEPAIPVVSNLTGEAVSAERIRQPEHWVCHARQTVRFADGIGWLERRGVKRFLELGPDGVLSAMAQECLASGADGGARATVLSGLRADRPEAPALLGALARLWVDGVDVDWAAPFARGGARRVALPTYAFQRRRYWVDQMFGSGNDAVSIGQSSADHPLLGAAMSLHDGHGWIFTGRLSLQSHPWLADHMVMGAPLLPGTAFLELALRAGAQVGCEQVDELTLEAPLVLPERGGVQLQVTVGEPDEAGVRSLTIHARPEHDAADGRHEHLAPPPRRVAGCVIPLAGPRTWPAPRPARAGGRPRPRSRAERP